MSVKVRVRNFQSISDAEIVIDGLTVLTGTNNAGKSAFFRAIRGAVTNTRGHAFVRYGEGYSTVDISFDDAKTLTWKKGKGVNTYIVNGEEIPKVGHGVPPEARVFGIDPVMAGKMELWPQIAPQITGVSFLLHESGSVMAEAVADVKRVNQLSRALAACDKDRRGARSNLKVRREDAKVFAEKEEKFVGLDDTVEEVFALEAQRVKTDKMSKAFANAGKLRDRYITAVAAVEALEGLEEASEALPAQEEMETAQELSGAFQEATKLRVRWSAVKAEVDALEGLEDAEKHLPSSERTKKAESVASGLRGARKLQGRYQGAFDEVAALEGLESAEETLPSDARMTYAQQFRKGVEVTVGLASRFEDARQELQATEDAQNALTDFDLEDKRVVLAQKFQKALGNALGLKERYAESHKAVADLEKQIEDQQAELDELTSQASDVLGTYTECPTCGGGLDHVH